MLLISLISLFRRLISSSLYKILSFSSEILLTTAQFFDSHTPFFVTIDWLSLIFGSIFSASGNVSAIKTFDKKTGQCSSDSALSSKRGNISFLEVSKD